jgi:hypothetical protein
MFGQDFKRTELISLLRISDITGASFSLSNSKRRRSFAGTISGKKGPTFSSADSTVVVTYNWMGSRTIKILSPSADLLVSTLCTVIKHLKQQIALEVSGAIMRSS